MKANIAIQQIVLLSLAATASAVAIQHGPPTESVTITVPSGTILRSRLEKGLRIVTPGQPVTVSVVEPVYVSNKLIIPIGTTLHGKIVSTKTTSGGRIPRILNGDFTPSKIAYLCFDELVLPNGIKILIWTNLSVGEKGVQRARYVPESERPTISRQIQDAVLGPFREPNKLQRFNESVITSLPYHPEYLDQGMIFTSTLLIPLTIPLSERFDFLPDSLQDQFLHVHLLTPLNSKKTVEGTAVKGIVFAPYYDAEQKVTLPVGTQLEGYVSRVVPAGSRKKNGTISFSFLSAKTPKGDTIKLHVTVLEIQAASDQTLIVDKEGAVKAATPRLAQGIALFSVISPASSAADPSANKTAFSRAAQGNSGYGLVGAGAAQASSSTSTLLGFYAAAKQIYGSYFAPGSDVILPSNTPLLLRSETAASTPRSLHDEGDTDTWIDRQIASEGKNLRAFNTRLRNAMRSKITCDFSARGILAIKRSHKSGEN